MARSKKVCAFIAENETTQRLIEYRDEEDRCQHPDHVEFKKEVLRKWADIGPKLLILVFFGSKQDQNLTKVALIY